jgi:hypothetical protein
MSDTPAKLSPAASVLAAIDAHPDWLPTTKGETRVVNTLLDDGKLTADWRGSGPRAVLVKLTPTASAVSPESRVSNWFSAPNDTAFIGALTRGIRDGSIKPEHFTAKRSK